MTHTTDPWAAVDASRTALMDSPLKGSVQAWRLWAACVVATAGSGTTTAELFVTGLANAAGIPRPEASRFLKRFNAAGVFGWVSAPTNSRRPGALSLPRVSPGTRMEGPTCPQAHETEPHVSPGTHSNGNATGNGLSPMPNALCAEGVEHYGNAVATGTHDQDTPGSTLRAPGVSGSEAPQGGGTPERDGDEARPPDYDWDAYDAQVEAAWRAAQASPDAVARFGEAEPAAVTDTEAWAMRHGRRR
jgi:hypothetical protein